MKNKVLFSTSFLIMIVALLFMTVNIFIYKLPDIAVRIDGTAIFIDLPILVYISLKGE